MSKTSHKFFMALAAAIVVIATYGPELQAQLYSNMPYRPVPWPKPWQPDGLNGSIDFGPTTALFADPNEDAIWIATRCGRTPMYHSSNEGCVMKPNYDMVFKFSIDGDLISRWGRGTLGGPHSMYVDRAGNVYVADEGGGAEYGYTAEQVDAAMVERKLGNQVVKFSPTGQVLLVIGTPGVEGNDESHFNHPSSVAVGSDGSIFVGDGHGRGSNNRIVKYTAEGRFVKQIGATQSGADIANSAWGKVQDAHAMTFDSRGRLFVADKWNYRVQIFDGELNLIDVWTQFGAPAGIAIDPASDVLVTADAESHSSPTMTNTGWEQGLYVGSARTGWVKAFIPALAPPVTGGDGGPEGAAIDRYGNIYWGETRSALDIRRSQHVMKYVDITKNPQTGMRSPGICDWWGFPAEREGRGQTGCGHAPTDVQPVDP